MANETAELTTLFADVSGSTTLYETIGDAAARSEIQKCLTLLTQCIGNYGGTVIKTIGDEIMCTLPNAEEGIEAACAMQQLISDTYMDSSAPLSIRVGFHHGAVIRESGDVFGDAVNVAARMAGMAKSGQVLTTRETVGHLTPGNQDRTRLIAKTQVKGKQELMEIFEVIWQEQDLTVMPASFMGTVPQSTGSTHITVAYKGSERVLDQSVASVTMGRGAQNDLVVVSPLASRVHARIEYRNGKFVLIDQSTNGSYLVSEDGTRLVLRREESPLTGIGTICLGQELEKDPEEAIHFRCS